MFAPLLVGGTSLFAEAAPDWPTIFWFALPVLAILALVLLCELLGMRYIPNNRVGLVEKLWSHKGSVTEGRIMALSGEAGYQADVLRGGFHFGLWLWQYRIHKVAVVTVRQVKIADVAARTGQPFGP